MIWIILHPFPAAVAKFIVSVWGDEVYYGNYISQAVTMNLVIGCLSFTDFLCVAGPDYLRADSEEGGILDKSRRRESLVVY
jgi:hypothetical protein